MLLRSSTQEPRTLSGRHYPSLGVANPRCTFCPPCSLSWFPQAVALLAPSLGNSVSPLPPSCTTLPIAVSLLPLLSVATLTPASSFFLIHNYCSVFGIVLLFTMIGLARNLGSAAPSSCSGRMPDGIYQHPWASCSASSRSSGTAPLVGSLFHVRRCVVSICRCFIMVSGKSNSVHQC